MTLSACASITLATLRALYDFYRTNNLETETMTPMSEAGNVILDACRRVGRGAVIALLEKYGAHKLPDVKVRDWERCIAELRALVPPPPPPPPPRPTTVPDMPVKFAIGDLVRGVGNSRTRKVVGYEVRYILEGEGFSRRAGYLEAVPQPPPLAKAPTEREWDIHETVYPNSHRGVEYELRDIRMNEWGNDF